MFVVVWEYQVRSGREAAFAAAYGPDGDWARLFRTDPEFLGTSLLCDVSDPSRFTTIDRWSSESAFQRFMKLAKDRYDDLDQRLSEMTEAETCVFATEVPSAPSARSDPVL